MDTAKNYLSSEEVALLNQIVTMYLDFAELQANQRKTITMAQWVEKLDAFLTINEQELLTHAGSIKADVAKALSHERYAEFDKHRKTAQAQSEDDTDLKAIEQMMEQATGKDNGGEK